MYRPRSVARDEGAVGPSARQSPPGAQGEEERYDRLLAEKNNQGYPHQAE